MEGYQYFQIENFNSESNIFFLNDEYIASSIFSFFSFWETNLGTTLSNLRKIKCLFHCTSTSNIYWVVGSDKRHKFNMVKVETLISFHQIFSSCVPYFGKFHLLFQVLKTGTWKSFLTSPFPSLPSHQIWFYLQNLFQMYFSPSPQLPL